MARIKVECFKKDKLLTLKCIRDSFVCPFYEDTEDCKTEFSCEECISKNVEFVIKENEKDD